MVVYVNDPTLLEIDLIIENMKTHYQDVNVSEVKLPKMFWNWVVQLF